MHTVIKVQNWLKSKFGDRFIDKSQRPTRSPDLKPCDYLGWGYLKKNIYVRLPKSIAELKANIENYLQNRLLDIIDIEIKNISKDDLSRVFDYFQTRIELVIFTEGGHFDLNLIYKNQIFYSL